MTDTNSDVVGDVPNELSQRGHRRLIGILGLLLPVLLYVVSGLRPTCVPIFANPGMSFFRTPCYERRDWEATKSAVLECERLGYDSPYVADYIFLGREGAIFEGWALSAFAGMTEKMLLAPIHLCDTFRNPALSAKMVATLDVVSDGRLLLFCDYGWRRAEFHADGLDFVTSNDYGRPGWRRDSSLLKG